MLAASESGRIDVIQALLAQCGPDAVDAATLLGTTPLMVACSGGHVAAAKCLLEKRAIVHAVTTEGSTALSLALHTSHRACAEILLDAGASCSSLGESGVPDWVRTYVPGSRAMCRAAALCLLGLRRLRASPMLNTIDRHLVFRIAKLIWSLRSGPPFFSSFLLSRCRFVGGQGELWC